MIKAGVSIKNIEGLDAQLEEVVAAIEGNLQAVAEDVRDNAVSSSAFHDKTGKLRQSISMRKSRYEGGGYIVQARAPHAALVEYGHVMIAWGRPTGRRVPAKPFMRPAIEKGIAKAVALFRSKKK